MSFAATLNPKWVTAGPWRQFGNWYLQPQSFSPIMLNPYAWYDAHTGGSSSGITDSSLNARAPMTVGAGSNSPLWLPYTTPMVTIPSAGSITTPDSAAFAFTGDQDIRWCGTLPDWTPAANAALVAQDSGAASGRRFTFYLSSTGKPGLIWSADGTAAVSKLSTVGMGHADGTVGASRVTLDVDDGAGNNVVRFYQKSAASLAEILDNSGWTLLDTVTTVGTTSVSGVSADSFRIGSSGAVAPNQSGVVAAAYLDGIDGTAVATFDASLCGQSGYTGPLGNVWSVNRPTTGPKTVVQSQAAAAAESLFLLGTDDWLDVPAAAIPALDTFAAPSSVVAVFRRWNNPGTSGQPMFTTKASSSNTLLGFALRLNTTASALTLNNVAGDGVTAETAAIGGSHAFGARAVAVASVSNVSPFASIAANGGAAGVDTSRTTTTTTNAGVAGRVGAYLGGSAPMDMEFRALLTFDRLLGDSEIAQLVAYYGGGL